jgi:hypothetical protein
MPRERKGVNSRKSKTDDTRKYFVVASEGADTERIYFEALRDGLIGQGITDKLIKIEFLKRDSEEERSESSHKKVIEQLDNYKKNYRLDKRDELWLVIDRDKQNNPIKNIADISKRCEQKGYFLALSNPNIEFWLLLHLEYLSNYTQKELDDFLKNKKNPNSKKSILEIELTKLLGGYNKSNYDITTILLSVEKAIEQAKKLDTNLDERWIEGRLGTRIYRLVEKILLNENLSKSLENT